MKNMIHGILLQESIKIPGRTFTPAFNMALHSLKDWRIEEYLKGIRSLDERVSRADFKINDMVKDNEYAQILMSIPGVGKLDFASEIDDTVGIRTSRLHTSDWPHQRETLLE